MGGTEHSRLGVTSTVSVDWERVEGPRCDRSFEDPEEGEEGVVSGYGTRPTGSSGTPRSRTGDREVGVGMRTWSGLPIPG